MKQKIENAISPLIDSLILIVVETIDFLGVISPQQWNKFEIIKQDTQWKLEWGNRLADLKAQISPLPVYGETEEAENKTDRVLSEDQIVILRNYDRDSSSKELDDMTRRYISEHNEIYRGIIYLRIKL